jgi:hypothetical protein
MTMNLTRDNLCIALADCFGYSPYDFDGMTLPEIAESLTLNQLNEVYDYMGIA